MTDFILTNGSYWNYVKGFKKVTFKFTSERDRFIDTLRQRIDNLTFTVDNLLNKLAQIESSPMVSETGNDETLKRVTSTSLEMGHNSQEKDSRRDCLKVVGIPLSLDDKNLQSTVYSILGESGLVC